MVTVVLVVHLMLAIALVAIVLVQKSEGGALGIGGGGMSGFMTGRSAANLLTRATAILAVCFFATSMTLALLSGGARDEASVIGNGPITPPPLQRAAPATPPQHAPKPPSGPAAPLAK